MGGMMRTGELSRSMSAVRVVVVVVGVEDVMVEEEEVV
jgi:hypothetical protein